MARKIRAYGSALSISDLSFWAKLGSSNIKIELLGSARLQYFKLRAPLARLSSTKNCWLDHPWPVAQGFQLQKLVWGWNNKKMIYSPCFQCLEGLNILHIKYLKTWVCPFKPRFSILVCFPLSSSRYFSVHSFVFTLTILLKLYCDVFLISSRLRSIQSYLESLNFHRIDSDRTEIFFISYII
jgi:hypothetical protein